MIAAAQPGGRRPEPGAGPGSSYANAGEVTATSGQPAKKPRLRPGDRRHRTRRQPQRGAGEPATRARHALPRAAPRPAPVQPREIEDVGDLEEAVVAPAPPLQPESGGVRHRFE